MQKEIMQQGRILIVDDQPANSALLERVLRQAGYTQFTSLNDPRQVIEQVRESRQQLADARTELDHINSGTISADQLAHLNKRIVQAVTSIERIGETAETFYPGQFLELQPAEAEEWAARGWANPIQST